MMGHWGNTGHITMPFSQKTFSISIFTFLLDMVLLVLLLLGGICIWPYLFQMMGTDPNARTLALIGAVDAGVSLMNGIAHMYLNHDFKVSDVTICAYLIALFLNFILASVFHVELMSGNGMWVTLLSLLFHALVVSVVAVVPAFLGTVVTIFIKALIWIRR